MQMMEFHNRLVGEKESLPEERMSKESGSQEGGDHSPGEVRKRHKQGSHSPDDSPQK